MGRRAVQHHGIRGSAALATQPLAPAAVPAESLEPGEMRRLPFAGELLGAARVRSGFIALPADAFDEAAPAMPAEAQAAYLQLMRLSFGEGRNWCRVTKRELERRLRLSERRLLRVLDGLVGCGLVRPLHRDNRGTLWRVFLPREAAGAPVGEGVLLGRVASLRDGSAGARSAAKAYARPELALAPGRADPAPPPRVAHRAAAPRASRRAAPGPLARALAEARGELDREGLARAEQEIAELVAEGQPIRRIAAGIEALRRTSPSSQGSRP